METPAPIHPFPARMAASIAWSILEKLPSHRPRQVLDPMAGSGTTLVVARKLGHKAIGIDIDPLAVLMASAWCADVDSAKVLKFAEQVAQHSAREWQSISQRDAYPNNANQETCEFVRYWFDPRSRRQLTSLARTISGISAPVIRNLLWCGFSRLIVVKQAGASLAMDVSHSRPHRSYDRAPIQPVREFLRAMRRVVAALPFTTEDRTTSPAASVCLGDARRLRLADNTIDVVITSPPYLNAIDYMRGHKLSLVWMEHSVPELRRIRSENIGSEAAPITGDKIDEHIRIAYQAGINNGILPNSQRRMFIRYLSDMRAVLTEIRRVLKENGSLSLVVGNSTIRGSFVQNSESIKALARKAGLRLKSEHVRALADNRRYLPPPRAKHAGSELSKRMRQEVVLQFSAQ
jgi:DNA modification methylase